MNDTVNHGYPAAEVEISQSLVERLIGEQFPELTAQAVTFYGSGWDNVTFRLGSKLAVRMPRLQVAVPLLELEQSRLPRLQRRLAVLLPVPVHIGEPGCGYPWRWSIVPWRPGVTAAEAELRPDQASRLGALLKALHETDPDGLKRSAWRGVPLAQRSDDFRGALRDLGPRPSTDGLAKVWEQALAAPLDPADDRWVHGDLHPKNLLVQDGQLVSILDWGDMTLGDRAIDLAAAWLLFDTDVHPNLWAAYGPLSDATLRRARGWAAFFTALTLRTGLSSDAAMAAAAERAARRLAGQSP